MRSTEGFNLSHAPNQKITHLLFVDDLKTYHKSEQKAAVVSSKLKVMFKDIGLERGINKCAAIHIKRGHLKTSGNNSMPAFDNTNIPLIGDHDHYKFLGKLQNTHHIDDKVIEEVANEYEKRMWVIWTSPLPIPRKIKATNTYALPSLQYYMWTTDWQINTLRDLDRLTRKIINECHGKHKYKSTQLLYLPSEGGGKGLMEIEALYKHTKIKAAHYTSDDVHIKLVKSFQKKKEDRNLKSVFKDARRYAEELQLDCQFNEEATVISDADQVAVISPETSRKS